MCDQDSIANKSDYIEIGLSCADVCAAIDRGLGKKGSYELSQSVLEAIGQLTTWAEPAICTSGRPLIFNGRTVAAIQAKILRQEKRNPVSRLFHAKDDKDTIAAWKQDLNRMLHVFNVRSTQFF